MATNYTLAHFVPKKSSTSGKVPATSVTVEGEISVNTNDEKIFLHTNSSTQATFSSDKYNDDRFVNTSGDTVDGALVVKSGLTVSGEASFSSSVTMNYLGEAKVIQDVISGNAYVTAQALNDLNERLVTVSGKTDENTELKLDKADFAVQLYPTYTLEESTNPEFEVIGTASVDNYIAHMGGYMILLKDGKAYAAKLKSTNWNYFADGTAVDDASKYETMIHVPSCNFLAEGKKMVFGGMTSTHGGHTFASPNWVGAYEMYVGDDGKGHSRPDVSPSHSKTMSAFWDAAQATSTDFGLANYQFHCLINAVYQAKYGNLNSQGAVGSGGQTSSWETWRDVLMGYGRTLGDGSGTAATSMDGQNCVKLFGFEDLWGKLWEFRPNIRFYYDSSASKRYAVVYEGNQVSNTAEGRTFEIPILNANGNYVSRMKLGEFWDMIPTAIGGSNATSYCDGYWDNSNGQLLYVGSHASDWSFCGLSCASSPFGFSYSRANIGARLAFYSSPEIVTGAELIAM